LSKSPDQHVIWAPQSGPQTALIQCPVFEVLFGGARGGGKTEGSIGDWLEHSSAYGEAAIGIFFRRKLVQLAEVIARTKQIFPKLGAKYHEQKKEWVMPNGARLKFAYLERDSDAEEYQGHNYTRIYVEEVTNFPTSAPIDKLRATLRSGAGVPVGMRLTGNPGGPGHQWVKRRYIDPDPKGYKLIREETEVEVDGQKLMVSLDRVFIPSKIADNVLLMRNDPTYILRLQQSGSAALVRAWLQGDWDIVDGAFFDEWDEALHVLPANDFKGLINPNMTLFRSFDWGSARPFSVGWYALLDRHYICKDRYLPEGALVKYQEWYGASGPNKGLKMTSEAVADGIKVRDGDRRVRYGVADPAIFIRNGGPSIGEAMAVRGISWRMADNKRKPGWEQVRGRLVGTDGIPRLFFCDSCEDTIRTLPTLQHDDTDVEDLDTDAEDHAADELRYAVMSRPWNIPSAQALTRSLSQQNPGYTFNDVLAMQTKRRVQREQWL
jgi:hypothetical protein